MNSATCLTSKSKKFYKFSILTIPALNIDEVFYPADGDIQLKHKTIYIQKSITVRRLAA